MSSPSARARWITAVAASTLAATLIAPTARAQNLVGNPGFENGTSTFSPWTIDFGDCGDDEQVAVGFNRRSGNYGLQLGGFQCQNGLRQTLATAIGRSYTVSLYARNALMQSAASESFQIMFGGTTLFNAPLGGAGTLDYRFLTFTGVATSTSTVLRVLAQNDNSYTFVDDVSVTPLALPTTVPEPTTLALVAGGLGIAAGLRRRRMA